jgi:hypothetical protein
MIYVIFNFIGLGMFLVAGLLAGLLLAVGLRFNEEWFISHGNLGKLAFMTTVGVFMIVLDILYRMTRGKRSEVFEGLENTKGSLFHPRSGGQFFYIPVWIWGGVWIALSLYDPPDVSARQSNPYARASVSQNSSYRGGSSSYSGSSESSTWFVKLGMISGVAPHRIATINGQPFGEGESHALTIGTSKVVVQCTEIHEESVVLTLSGDPQPHELKTGEHLVRGRKGWILSQRGD